MAGTYVLPIPRKVLHLRIPMNQAINNNNNLFQPYDTRATSISYRKVQPANSAN